MKLEIEFDNVMFNININVNDLWLYINDNCKSASDKSSAKSWKLPKDLKVIWRCLFQILERDIAFIAWLFYQS